MMEHTDAGRFLRRLREEFSKHDHEYRLSHACVYIELHPDTLGAILESLSDDEMRYMRWSPPNTDDIVCARYWFMTMPIRRNDSIPAGSYRVLATKVIENKSDEWLESIKPEGIEQ